MKFIYSIKFKIILLVAVPFMGFVVMLSLFLNSNIKEYNISIIMKKNMDISIATSYLIDSLQKERGKTSIFVNKNLSRKDIDIQREISDNYFKELTNIINTYNKKGYGEIVQKTQFEINDIRNKANSFTVDFNHTFGIYTKNIEKLSVFYKKASEDKTSKGIGKLFSSLQILEDAKEGAGRFRGFSSGIVSRDTKITDDEFFKINNYKVSIDFNINSNVLLLSEKSKQKVDELVKSNEWNELERAFLTILNRANVGSFGIDSLKHFNNATLVIDKITEISNIEFKRIDQLLGKIKYEAFKNLIIIIAIFLFLVLFVVILSTYIYRSIVIPVNEMRLTFQEIASGAGDLTKVVSLKSKDEIGELANYFNIFIDKLNDILYEVFITSNGLLIGSKQVSESAMSLSHVSSELSQDVNITSQNINLLEETIISNAKESSVANNLSTSAKEEARAVEVAVNETVKLMNRVAEMTQMITDIANNTNMLALNASIEAARAGSAGEGFAVVASEVRKLAERSLKSSDEIKVVLENSAKVSQNAGVYVSKLIPEIVSTSNINKKISELSEKQKDNIDDLKKLYDKVVEISLLLSSNSEELASSSEEMTSQINSLVDIVNTFKLKNRE